MKYTSAQIEIQLENISEKLRQIIFSVETYEILKSIREKYQLSQQQAEALGSAVGLVLMQLLPPEKLSAYLVESIPVPQTTADLITTDIETNIILPIKSEFTKKPGGSPLPPAPLPPQGARRIVPIKTPISLASQQQTPPAPAPQQITSYKPPIAPSTFVQIKKQPLPEPVKPFLPPLEKNNTQTVKPTVFVSKQPETPIPPVSQNVQKAPLFNTPSFKQSEPLKNTISPTTPQKQEEQDDVLLSKLHTATSAPSAVQETQKSSPAGYAVDPYREPIS